MRSMSIRKQTLGAERIGGTSIMLVVPSQDRTSERVGIGLLHLMR